MLVLPLLFIGVVAQFPVGLVLYWVTTNLWTVGQGLVTRGLRPKQAPPPKRTSRTPPKEREEPADGAQPAEAEAPRQQAPSQPRRVKRKKKRKARR